MWVKFDKELDDVVRLVVREISLEPGRVGGELY